MAHRGRSIPLPPLAGEGWDGGGKHVNLSRTRALPRQGGCRAMETALQRSDEHPLDDRHPGDETRCVTVGDDGMRLEGVALPMAAEARPRTSAEDPQGVADFLYRLHETQQARL